MAEAPKVRVFTNQLTREETRYVLADIADERLAALQDIIAASAMFDWPLGEIGEAAIERGKAAIAKAKQ